MTVSHLETLTAAPLAVLQSTVRVSLNHGSPRSSKRPFVTTRPDDVD